MRPRIILIAVAAMAFGLAGLTHSSSQAAGTAFGLSDFKGPFIASVSGKLYGADETFAGSVYLIPDGQGRVAGSWRMEETATGGQLGFSFDPSRSTYTVAPDGAIEAVLQPAPDGTTQSVAFTFHGYLGRAKQEVLGYAGFQRGSFAGSGTFRAIAQ